jgi:acyl-CoA thioesterase-1
MDGIIYIFGSGAAFFLGTALVLIAVGCMVHTRTGWLSIVSTVCALAGLILVAASATPLPYWLYSIMLVMTLVWLAVERSTPRAEPASPAGSSTVTRGARRHAPRRASLRMLVVGVWLSAVLFELPYQFTPDLEPMGNPRVYLFADSVSAGMADDDTQTWPRILAGSRGVEVLNYSHMGATVRSMVRKAQSAEFGDGIVLLEIGGNDLLGTTAARDYETQLEELLALVCGPGREVVMFELPLPPFANEYGLAQRRLASRYRVRLIPKRVFVSVLTKAGATVDSIHLTPSGHECMAETVWGILRPAFGEAQR